jgi:hypothetical protein
VQCSPSPFAAASQDAYDRVVQRHPPASRSRCGLAVVIAGIVRSGSTLQQKLARDAVQRAGLHRGGQRPPAVYWSWHAHVRMGDAKAKEWAAQFNAWAAALTPQDAVVIKCHQWRPEIFGFCRRTVVLTTHRDVIDVAASAQRVGWAESPQALRRLLAVSLRHHAQWAAVADVNARYVDLAAPRTRRLHIAQICAALVAAAAGARAAPVSSDASANDEAAAVAAAEARYAQCYGGGSDGGSGGSNQGQGAGESESQGGRDENSIFRGNAAVDAAGSAAAYPFPEAEVRALAREHRSWQRSHGYGYGYGDERGNMNHE